MSGRSMTRPRLVYLKQLYCSCARRVPYCWLVLTTTTASRPTSWLHHRVDTAAPVYITAVRASPKYFRHFHISNLNPSEDMLWLVKIVFECSTNTRQLWVVCSSINTGVLDQRLEGPAQDLSCSWLCTLLDRDLRCPWDLLESLPQLRGGSQLQVLRRPQGPLLSSLPTSCPGTSPVYCVPSSWCCCCYGRPHLSLLSSCPLCLPTQCSAGSPSPACQSESVSGSPVGS